MPTEQIIELVRAMEENAYRILLFAKEKYGVDSDVCKREELVWIERYRMLQILTDAEHAQKLFDIYCTEEGENDA